MTVPSGCFWVHSGCFPGLPNLCAPSHPGPYLLLVGVAAVFGRPLMVAMEALHKAVSLRFQPVLHMLTYFPVGWFGRGAFGHCCATVVDPRRELACRNTEPGCGAKRWQYPSWERLQTHTRTANSLIHSHTRTTNTLTHSHTHTHTHGHNPHAVEPENPAANHRKSTPRKPSQRCLAGGVAGRRVGGVA